MYIVMIWKLLGTTLRYRKMTHVSVRESTIRYQLTVQDMHISLTHKQRKSVFAGHTFLDLDLVMFSHIITITNTCCRNPFKY